MRSMTLLWRLIADDCRCFDLKKPIWVMTLFVMVASAYANCAYLINDNQQSFEIADREDTHLFQTMTQSKLPLSSWLKTSYFPPFVHSINIVNNHNLGAEDFYIADALAKGRGFSSPFRVETGATAWMPPVHVFFLASLRFIIGDKTTITIIVTLLKNLVLILTGLMIVLLSTQFFKNISPWYPCCLYLATLTAWFFWYFQITFETWFSMFVLDIGFITFYVNHCKKEPLAKWPFYGVIAGLAMLTSPSVGIVVCILIAIALHGSLYSQTTLVSNFLVFLLLVGSWSLRNAWVMGQPYFVKSNFFYEAYIINYKNKLGINQAHRNTDHPYFSVPQRNQHPYRTLGEHAYLARHKKAVINALIRDPLRYMRNIGNRLYAIFVSPQHYFVDGLHWGDRNNQKVVYREAPGIHALRLFLTLLTTLSLIITAIHYRRRGFIFAAIFVIYLLPYILVTYYYRYAMPLTALRILVISAALNICLPSIKNLLKQRKIVDWIRP